MQSVSPVVRAIVSWLTPAVCPWLLAGCASVHSAVQILSAPGTPGTRSVAVYYALPPPFAYRAVGDIHVVATGDEAHLDEVLSEAETRARGVGADALILHDVRTTAQYIQQLVWRSCTTDGPMGRSLPDTCPTQVNVLTVETRLEATAVRNDPIASPVSTLWRPPPPLGAAGMPRGPEVLPEPTLPDLDETLALPH